MIFFGPRPWGPAIDDRSLYLPVNPVASCSHCHEPIEPQDYGVSMPSLDGERVELAHFHQECEIRMLFGSVGHHRKECSCFGGDQEDPPDMTARQAAKAASELFFKRKR